MNQESITFYLELILEFAVGIFSETSIIFLIVGLIFLLLGSIIIALLLYIFIKGERVDGKVIGAVKEIRSKEKIRDNKKITEENESLFAIFEYIHPNGYKRQDKASSGGTSVLKYKTGQKVKLILCSGKTSCDVYDADDYSGFIVGGILFLIGSGITYGSASFYASLGLSGLALLGIVVSLLFKILENKKNKSKYNCKPTEVKIGEIRAIEEFVKEENQKKHNHEDQTHL